MRTQRTKRSALGILGFLLVLNWTTAAMAANASLSWDANTESDLAGYKVYFGTASRSYGAPVDVGNQTAYTITGLSEGQTYYFAVTAYNDADSESAFSAEVNKTFADTVSPVLSSMAAGSITSTGAVITWTTNEAATAQVEYGTTTAYGSSSALRSTLLTSHTRTLSGLAPSTLYHYRVISRDAAGNTATSGDNTFTTAVAPDTTPPAISGISAGNLTPTSATVSWTTNESADTQIQYGPTTAYGSSTTLNTTLSTAHSQNLTGLTGATTYHYRVLSKDAAGNLATSGDNTFTTPAPPDTTAPTLSGITINNLLSTSVEIAWSTNEGATSQVEYGTTTAYGASSALNTTLVTSHTRTLSNLSPSTTYHYRIISKDAADNIATSGDRIFTTPAPPDTTPPTFSGIAAGSLTSSGATISWTTNELADTQVQYGTTTAYGSTTSLNSALTTAHTQDLTGLSPSTTYHYRVLSRDAAGNLATSGDNTFTTPAPPDTTPPTLSAISAGSITSSSVTISWTTNESADTQVQYGITTAYGSSTPLNTTLTTAHSERLTGLTPSTTYHYRVLSKDAAGNLATSGDGTFTTPAPPDNTPPAFSGITASSLTFDSVAVTWSTNEPSSSQVEYGTTTAYGSLSNLDGTLVTSHTRTLSNLNPSTTYHFRVISKDAANNTATSGDNTFTTSAAPDTIAPTLSAVAAGTVTATSAVITWTTNEAATSQVEYGTTSAYGSSSALGNTLLTGHTRTLSNLSPSTTYHFRVISKDAANNTATSGDNTFTTPALPDTTPPTLSAITEGGLSSSSVTISWTTNEAADTQVQYGTTSAYGSTTSLNNAMTTSHSQGLTGLSPSTLYHYRVLSKDAAGNLATSGDNTFTTSAPPDTTPPTFSGIAAGNLTNSSATISWTTNELSDTQIQYGTTTAYGSSTSLNMTLTTSHNQGLTGLSAATTYHFRVLSRDAAGNLATSGDNLFTTPALPDTAAPILSGITTGNLTASSVVISWNTNEPATARVEYGTTTAYGALSTLDATLGTGHTRTLNNLNPSTTYHFRVISKDAADNTALSGDHTFTTAATPDTTGPGLSQITAGDLRADRVAISWGTDEPATTQVEYGTTAAYGNLTTLNATLMNSHSEILSGLQSETVYHYRVRSADAAGNLSVSDDQTFTTAALGDVTPPADVESFRAVPGVQNVTLDWVNPSDPDFAGVRILYRTDRFPAGLNDGTILGDFAGQPNESVSVIHAGLESNVTYYYSASSYDRSGNFQNTARASAMPLGIAESRSTSQEDGGAAAGGGCAMISPGKENAGGPLDSAEWLGLVGLILTGLLRKRQK
ncbi:MAG: fibronectin type III domain-containing protein [Candidatus Manganitrophus sp.]|nr:fibronectin type III domain-containing protein [Candidatus Manganitrophus sp.]MDC4225469.1 fibronectin type III domain-containing protein [Candidatus Manganitrophus sp.]WDT73162.1 MAG: fibronectin type III domain-containing protein [Candidatus Manganitrophus sp.]WDT79298.1 MAG: fibronectin type III domain-containing protein [Candidatus Manganitrophus sp.]